jgi:ferric-dicitrate binding protein FerR (iron transport regulator)
VDGDRTRDRFATERPTAMGRKTVQARRRPESRPARRWRRRVLAAAAVTLFGGLIAYLGLNYGWSGSVGEGDTAPAFTLDDQEGRPVNLADYLGRKPVVLFFYMTYG